MAYGPLCQCAFMSYGPRIQMKAPAKYEDRVLYDKLPNFEAPAGSEAPPPGAFTLYAVDTVEAKADPNYNVRYMPMDSKCVVFGASRDVEGLVYDGNKGVLGEHTALFYAKGKWFIKSVNGNTYIDSMTLHPYLRDSDGRAPRRFNAEGGKKTVMLTPVDPKKKATRERCVFRMADSDRIFWLVGPLALGDGEVELEAKTGEARRGRGDDDRKGKRREGRDDDRKDKRRTGRDRTPSRSRTRSRSRTPKKRR